MIRTISWVQWYQNQPHTTAPYGPCSSLLWPHSKPPFKGDNFLTQHHKIHQNVQLNKQRTIQPSRPSEHSWQHSQPKIITQKEQIKELYADVFEGIGCFPGKPYHINLDQSVTPAQTQCRPVPVHLKEVFKQEVNKMLNAGILKPVEKATPWINSFVLVKGKSQMEALISESVWIQPIWTRQWFVNLTAARLLRTLHIF